MRDGITAPKLTAVTPARAPTHGRYLVALTGKNFRVAPTPPPAAYARGAEQETVGVWINGIRCAHAYAAASTTAYAEVPEWTGTPGTGSRLNAVSVTIANLNDAGAVIAGETATLAAGFAYEEANLTLATPFERVLKELLYQLRRHVLRNTHWIRSRDYDADPAARADDPTRATVPRLDLVGPTLTAAPDWGQTRADAESTGTTTWRRPQRQRTYHLGWTLDAYCADANAAEPIALAVAAEQFFVQVPYVTIPADPAAPSGTQWQYELAVIDPPAFDVAPQGDGLRHFSVNFELRGVDLGPQDLQAVEQGWTVYDADAPTVAAVPIADP
jgi:hypothetical protein